MVILLHRDGSLTVGRAQNLSTLRAEHDYSVAYRCLPALLASALACSCAYGASCVRRVIGRTTWDAQAQAGPRSGCSKLQSPPTSRCPRQILKKSCGALEAPGWRGSLPRNPPCPSSQTTRGPISLSSISKEPMQGAASKPTD